MLTFHRSIFPAACIFALLTSPDCASPGDRPVQERYVSLAVQGDLRAVPELLEQPVNQGDPDAVLLAEKFHARFIEGNGPAPAGADAPLAASIAYEFRSYWRSGLFGEERSARKRLEQRLIQMLASAERIDYHAGAVFGDMGRRLAANGVYHFQNAELPFHDLFLWLDQTSARYTVQLTDRSMPLTVHFLDGFLLQGWKEYATLGLASTSGWVDGGELFCVADAYDRNSETFEIAFLKHEARHLADLERYPRMDSTELEYRAKLTELAFANRSMKQRLDDFTSKAAQNAESPHAMANWRIIRDIYWGVSGAEMPDGFNGWDRLGPGKVNRVARELLKASTVRHETSLATK